MKQADELDVFEAASYYAEAADSGTVQGRSNMVEKEWRGERRTEGPPPRQKVRDEKPKQPLTPGGRLASFLISFFQHGSSRQKKSALSIPGRASVSCKHEDEGRSTGRRKRRVSESSLFVYSSRSPCKVNVDKKTHHKSWRRGPSKAASGAPREVFHGGRSGYGDPLREGGRRVSINGMSEKDSRFYCESLLQFEERSFWRRGEEEQEGEDGSESDSSSDLFDLPNYELVRF
ncbi:unnamed protein product [Spirodela intermedia]|uniref:Uncharacterized protein n=1 Tax=Spirodela intermedia TaxID=51605 RepID=A0A7I8K7C1_SPIIN|nr:unnamed protein product [Spirodela intermedia]